MISALPFASATMRNLGSDSGESMAMLFAEVMVATEPGCDVHPVRSMNEVVASANIFTFICMGRF
jgi:hypothetical protein